MTHRYNACLIPFQFTQTILPPHRFQLFTSFFGDYHCRHLHVASIVTTKSLTPISLTLISWLLHQLQNLSEDLHVNFIKDSFSLTITFIKKSVTTAMLIIPSATLSTTYIPRVVRNTQPSFN